MTQPLWLLLTSIALLAPPEVQPGEAPSGGHVALDRFAQMGPAAQREWVRQILTRLDRANRVVLEPHEVVGERARYVFLLRQMAQGKTMSRPELTGLLREVDEREKAAIERLARRFRVQVYRTFRQRRGLFTRRRAAWNRVLALWEAAGGPLDQQDQLIDWLQLAIHNSTPATVGPLPPNPEFEAPRFEADTEIPQALVFQEPTARINEPLPIRPPRPAVSLPERDRRTAELKKPHQPSAETVDLPQPAVLPPARVAPRRVIRSGPVPGQASTGRPPPAATRRPAGLASVVGRPLPVIVPPAESTPGRVAVPAAVVEPRRAAGVLPKPPEQPASTVPPSDRLALPAPPAIAPPRRLPVGGPTAMANKTKQPPSPAVGTRVATLPTLDRPTPSVPPGADPPPGAPRVEVNLDELAARIAGANLALRALQAELDEDGEWNARRLAPLIIQLRILVTQKNDLTMLRELVSRRQRAVVGRLLSPRAAITRLAARIFQARTRASAPDFPGAEARREAELLLLDELSRELAELGSGK